MSDSNGRSPFADLRAALLGLRNGAAADGASSIRIDPTRAARTGIPEIVHAGNKTSGDVAEGLRRLAEANGRALASRVSPEETDAVRSALEPDFDVEHYSAARVLIVAKPGIKRPAGGGVVGLLSAGTSDVPIASEASLMAAEMGARTLEAWDVGIAGLHRLIEPLEWFVREDVDAIVVAAGMDGALPAVVAGLVDVPVIGLPTSVGYGVGGEGIGALTTMLQSCAPGLVVVNIDNGIGAGSTAALIANRAARHRAPVTG